MCIFKRLKIQSKEIQAKEKNRPAVLFFSLACFLSRLMSLWLYYKAGQVYVSQNNTVKICNKMQFDSNISSSKLVLKKFLTLKNWGKIPLHKRRQMKITRFFYKNLQNFTCSWLCFYYITMVNLITKVLKDFIRYLTVFQISYSAIKK